MPVLTAVDIRMRFSPLQPCKPEFWALISKILSRFLSLLQEMCFNKIDHLSRRNITNGTHTSSKVEQPKEKGWSLLIFLSLHWETRQLWQSRFWLISTSVQFRVQDCPDLFLPVSALLGHSKDSAMWQYESYLRAAAAARVTASR